MKRIILLSLLCVFILGFSASAQDFESFKNTDLCFNPNGETIGLLNSGFHISQSMIIEKQNGWWKIRISLDNKGYVEGWIDSTLFTEIETKRPFEFNNVTLRSDLGMIKVIGEITNNSGISYTIANFIVSVYNASGRLINTGYINITNLDDGQTKSFSGYIDASISAVETYKIQFENGF